MRALTCLFTLIFALSAHSADQPVNRPANADLWIAHLDRYEAAHSDLTDEQRLVLSQGRDLLAGGLLRQLRSPNGMEAAEAQRMLAAFKARASNAFSREAYAEAFVRLPRPSSQSAVPMYPYCDCNEYTGDCAGECVTGGGGCRATPDGCGTFGTDPCFGLCF